MAVNQGKTGLAGKLGGRLDKAVRESADKPVNYGNLRLPGGIDRGIAKITDCGFYQYDDATQVKKADGNSAAGEYYFRAAASVVEPKEVIYKGVVWQVRGQPTSIMHSMFDTKKSDGTVVTLEEHAADVLNELKKLGGQDFCANATADDLESLAADIKAAAPYTYFSTNESKEVKNPDGTVKWEAKVWERWNGSKGLENHTEDAAPEDVEDNTKPEPAAKPNPVMAAPAANGKGPPKKPAAPAKSPEPEYRDDEDLKSLGERADGPEGRDSDDAQAKLGEMAKKAGIKPDKDGAFPGESWSELADMIGGGQPDPNSNMDGSVNAEPGQDGFVPEVTGVYMYTPEGRNPKTKKPYAPVECEVTKVSTRLKLVDLLSNVDRKTAYKDIDWDALGAVS